MKTLEFESTVTDDGQIAIPAEIAAQLPIGSPVRVFVQWDGTDDEDGAWRTMGRQRFEAAYAPEDTVYDNLLGG